MDSKRLVLLAMVVMIVALTGTPAHAIVKYETWARADLTLQAVKKVDFWGGFIDVGRPTSPVLDSFSFSSSVGAAGTGGPGIATADHDGGVMVDGSDFNTDGVHHTDHATGYAQGHAAASSLHSTSTTWDFFFDPWSDWYDDFWDGDALVLDLVLDYEYYVSVSRTDPSETVDALASISLLSFFPVDTLSNALGLWWDPWLYPQLVGVDFIETVQLSDTTDTVSNFGQLNFSLVLDSWGFSFDSLTLNVDVDGFGISRVPVSSPLSLIALALLGWLLLRRRSTTELVRY